MSKELAAFELCQLRNIRTHSVHDLDHLFIEATVTLSQMILYPLNWNTVPMALRKL